jgi:hypothetical protein
VFVEQHSEYDNAVDYVHDSFAGLKSI